MSVVKREVIPTAFELAVQPSPFSDDPHQKVLIVALPMEMENWLLPLNDEQLAMLHDSTEPSALMQEPAGG